MHKPLRVAAGVATAACLLTLVPAVMAVGDDGGPLLESGVAGSVPATVDDARLIFDAAPGARAWDVSAGRVEVSRGGELELRVAGLVFTGTGGTGPVTSVSASLYCNGKRVATTPTSPLSADGAARIEADVTVPPLCLAPVVLVNPNGNPRVYIAASG